MSRTHAGKFARIVLAQSAVAADMLANLGVPSQIARLARDLLNAMPGSALLLGELLQNEGVLNPYFTY